MDDHGEVDKASEPYVVLDSDLRIVSVSDACSRDRGLQRRDVVGRHVLEVFPTSVAAPEPAAIREQSNILENDEAVLRIMVDSAPMMVWMKDTEGRYVTANRPFVEYLRQPDVSQVKGRTDLDLQPTDLAQKYRADDAEVMATRRPKYVEEEAFDGATTHWIETWKVPVIDERDRVVGTVGFFRDDTDRRQAEETRRVHATILENLSEGISLVRTSDGVIVFTTPQFERMFGYGPAEVIGQHVSIINAPTDRSPQQTARDISSELERKGVWAGEVQNIRKDGTHFWCLAHVRTANLPRFGDVWVVVHEDITHRKYLEQRQREAEERFTASFEASAIGLAMVSAQGRFLDVNPAFCRLVGYSRDELRKMTFPQITHPEDRSADQDRFRALVAGSAASLQREKRYLHKAGHEVHAVVNSSRVADTSGQVDYFFAQIQDITDHKKAEAERALLEAQVRESQKMESLGTLAGGLAHDFNNLLAMIMGNVRLAQQDVGPHHPAFVSLDEIDRASRRARDLVGQVLAFARREKPQRRVISLETVVIETGRLVRATLPAMVSLDVECDRDVPPVVADPTQIGQVVLNLCSNASQALEGRIAHGHIAIRLRSHLQGDGASPASLPPGRYACLSVRDDGVGIDETTRARIFDPFFTTRPAGTGLGLSVVHSIVQAHEAALEVETAAGEGSTFRIYFPACEAHESAPPAAASEAPRVQGASRRVLFIDDEESIVFLMARLLARRGFHVKGCRSAREAVEAVRAAPDEFDLAVTDYNMPILSGLEVADLLRQIRPDLPVLLASGYVTEELRQKARDAGVRKVIYKPDVVDDLCEAITHCFTELHGG